MKLWKWVVLALPLVILFIILGSSLQNKSTVFNDPGESVKTEINIWAWDIAAKGLESTISSFQENYPDVKVTVLDIPWHEVTVKLDEAMANGSDDLPDIIAAGNDFILPYWFDRYPDAFVDLSRFGAKQYEEQFDPNKWHIIAQQNKILGLPWDSAPVGLFYRNDIFSHEHLDIGSVRTWDDWYKLGITLREQTNGQIKLMAADITNGHRLFMFMLQQQGLSIFDEKGQVNINNPKAIETLTILQKMSQQDLLYNAPNWKPEILEAVHDGKVASVINGVWFTGLLSDRFPDQEGKWRIMLPPSFDANQIQIGDLGGSFLLISSQSRHPEEAYAFIENALATNQGQLTMFEEYQLLPSFLPTHNHSAFHEPVEYFDNQRIWRTFVEAVKYTPKVNHTMDYVAALELLREPVQSVLLENADPRTELNRFAEELARITGRKLAN